MRQAQQVEAAAKLAAGVAEEYANLLAVIRGQAERLLDQFGDFSPARQAAEGNPAGRVGSRADYA